MYQSYHSTRLPAEPPMMLRRRWRWSCTSLVSWFTPPPSVIARHAHVDALAADRRDARQQREPAGDLIFDEGRRIAAAVGHHLHIDATAEIFAGGELGADPLGDVGGEDAQPVEAHRAAERVDRVEAAARIVQRSDRRG